MILRKSEFFDQVGTASLNMSSATDGRPAAPDATGNAPSQINEHRAFQAVFWQVQRLAWVGLGGLLVMALLGLTGGRGWFSQAVVMDDMISISYPAILRQQTDGQIAVTILNPDVQTLLHFDGAFQENFTITSMSPPPVHAFATSLGTAFKFALSGAGPTIVRINVIAAVPARVDFTVVTDGRMALLSTLVLP